MSATWWSKQGQTATTTTTTAAPHVANGPTSTTPPATTMTFAQFFGANKNATTQQSSKLAADPWRAKQPQQIPPVNQQLSSAAVLELLKGLKLEGAADKYETSVIFAKSNNHLLGGEDTKLVGFRWFRAAEGGTFDELQVDKPFYQPSFDDIGYRLCVQCYDLKDQTSSSFAEYGPIQLDPKVAEKAADVATKVSANIDGTKYIIYRPPSSDSSTPLVTLKRDDDEGDQGHPVQMSWKLIAKDATKVLMGDGREIVFESSFDRDVATLMVRSNPPVIVTANHISRDEERRKFEQQEKQLRDRIMELEAQLMAERARGGAAQTGKALAEAQSLRRELDKTKQENSSLVDQLAVVNKAKLELEERIRTLESSIAILSSKDQANTSLQRELDSAKEQLQRSKEQANKSKERADKAEFALNELDERLPKVEQRAKKAEDRVKELEAKVAQSQTEVERAVGRRNAAQQKADSLAKDMARMLRATPGGLEEVEATMRENASLKQTLEEVRAELRQTRSAYEAQLASGRIVSAKAVTAGGADKGKSSQLEHLANSLMSEVKAKDEAIESQKSEIQKLNIRLLELQKRLKDRSGSLSG